jgi:two-component system chemotaxis sensor kinase CheA
MQIDLKRFQETFFEEAEEHLGTIESGLLNLADHGADAELLNTVFRSAHSIKGAAGSFGFNELARLTHVMENVLDRMRSGRRAPDATLTQRLLRASDRLRDLVAATPPRSRPTTWCRSWSSSSRTGSRARRPPATPRRPSSRRTTNAWSASCSSPNPTSSVRGRTSSS